MALKLIHLPYGLRIFFTSLKSRMQPKKYSGNAGEICQQIIDDCWNGHFLQTSTTNFQQFWTRDFGWCCRSLLQLGYKNKVHQTLRYALNRFQKYKKITTTITSKGRPFDVPNPAVDSLPYLIHSIRISGFSYLFYKKFLNWKIREFFEKVINPVTGLVKPEKRFSSMKDLSIRKSSCYDNVMVALLASDLKVMKLENPFARYNYPALIKQYFWNGSYFYDDLTKQDYIAGDANVMPFALGIIQNKEMLESVLKKIQEAGLDLPVPLKYTNKETKTKSIWEEIFIKGYEKDAIWTHMAPFYIQLVKKIDSGRARGYKQQYKEMIENYGTYPEVLAEHKGKVRLFRTPFYFADRGMLWAANYLTL